MYDAPLRQLTSSYLVATFFNNFLPSNIGGDVVRVRDGSRLTGSTTASLAVVGIDRILGFGALYVLAAAAFVLGGSVERELAGARVVLVGLGARVPGARLHLLPPGHRPRAARGLAARPLPVAARAVRDGAGRRAHATGRGSAPSRGRSWRSLAIQTLAVWYYVSIARALRHPAAGVRRVPDGPALHPAAGGPHLVQRLGPARGPVHASTSRRSGLPRESALAFSLVGAGLMVLLSLSGAVAWLARRHPLPEPSPGA